MPELRWILLILGALFVAALAWWELKRQRREWHKSAVYRLDGAGDGGLAVVGKRCLRSTGRVERSQSSGAAPPGPGQPRRASRNARTGVATLANV